MTLHRFLTLICILLSILPERGLCNCPVYGCTLFHSFTTPTQFFNSSFRPELLWKFEHPELRPTGAGCVTNGGRILCPMVYSEQERSILISWDALTNGRLSWNVTLDGADLPLPVVDVSGEVLASNGYKLLGFMPNGKPFGKPISLYPIHGQVMDLSISSGQFVILLYKCGFLAVYITNGIPHASIWLNDTVNGLKGTFIPLSTPAVNSSSSERLYVLTAFRSRQQPQNNSSHDMNMRLYAFDVTGNMAYRIQTVWHYDFILPSASIPYLGSQETECNMSYPPDTGSTDPAERQISPNSVTDLPAYVVIQGDIILVVLNFNDIKSGDRHCRLLTVTNLEKSYSINFSKDIDQECYGIAYNSLDSALYTNNASSPNQMKVWLHVFDPVIHDSSLLLTDMHSGDVVMTLNLSALLGKDKAKITSQMLIAYLYLGNNTVNHSTTAKVLKKSPIPLILGVTDGSGEGSVVAIDLSFDMKVIWTIPVIGGQSVSGQICTLDRLQDSLLVFTDQSGVYFFKIS